MASDFIESAILKGVELRTDLLKWKMIAVGAIGSFGLGGKDISPNSHWALVLIPFLCVYVDIIYRNSCMRRDALRSFVVVNRENHAYAALADVLEFEREHFKKRVNGRPFEAAALVWSSLLLSAAILTFPCIADVAKAEANALYVSGALGMILAGAVELAYWWRRELIKS